MFYYYSSGVILFFYISMVEEYSLYLKNVFIFVHSCNVTIHFSDSFLLFS